MGLIQDSVCNSSSRSISQTQTSSKNKTEVCRLVQRISLPKEKTRRLLADRGTFRHQKTCKSSSYFHDSRLFYMLLSTRTSDDITRCPLALFLINFAANFFRTFQSFSLLRNITNFDQKIDFRVRSQLSSKTSCRTRFRKCFLKEKASNDRSIFVFLANFLAALIQLELIGQEDNLQVG